MITCGECDTKYFDDLDSCPVCGAVNDYVDIRDISEDNLFEFDQELDFDDLMLDDSWMFDAGDGTPLED
jgi:hypothetical protein